MNMRYYMLCKEKKLSYYERNKDTILKKAKDNYVSKKRYNKGPIVISSCISYGNFVLIFD